MELVRSKNDMMSLNNQLLEAIQRKLELSQELEAWQVNCSLFSHPPLSHHPSACHPLPQGWGNSRPQGPVSCRFRCIFDPTQLI
uniref:Uncharacterized protein n=1 Tax=Oreochromis niloticus TaxID=8128 RepID=A0A669BSP3_ORENI